MRLEELLCKECKKHFGFRYRSYMGIIRDLEYYKDGYCKDCYLERLETENEQLRVRVAHYEKVLANPPAIY